MQYRILGKSGLKVSVVGFGGIPIQRITAEEAKTVIISAEEAGINFIDTARAYTVSENYIGEALEGRRDRWIIASKSMARDRESMARDVDTSLKNLQTDYIDLYQIHNVRTQAEMDKVFGENGAYRSLVDAKARGKIGHIGITGHSSDMLKIAIESYELETGMYPYSIVETQAEELFKRAAELNIGVMAMKPLAGGALQDGTLAMKFILEKENVTMALPGMASVDEVRQNAAAGSGFAPLTPEEKKEIAETAKQLGSRFCRRCGYCGPCPQGIDIASMFLFESYKKRYNLAGWAEERYFSCAKRAKDCVECGACEKKCPYELPIRNMLKGVKETFNEY